jgi:hypothetical protein
VPIREWFMGGVEAKDRIETARKKGRAMTGKEFEPQAMKDAIRALNSPNSKGSGGSFGAAEDEQRRRGKK